mmetsp:Transcript_26446/g.69540  ORF Transcript_26446/g.69540 Transcript_26446/m.69540 type:complete len:202 (-) Transcript_26446:2542-3147(-)
MGRPVDSLAPAVTTPTRLTTFSCRNCAVMKASTRNRRRSLPEAPGHSSFTATARRFPDPCGAVSSSKIRRVTEPNSPFPIVSSVDMSKMRERLISRGTFGKSSPTWQSAPSRHLQATVSPLPRVAYLGGRAIRNVEAEKSTLASRSCWRRRSQISATRATHTSTTATVVIIAARTSLPSKVLSSVTFVMGMVATVGALVTS